MARVEMVDHFSGQVRGGDSVDQSSGGANGEKWAHLGGKLAGLGDGLDGQGHRRCRLTSGVWLA